MSKYGNLYDISDEMLQQAVAEGDAWELTEVLYNKRVEWVTLAGNTRTDEQERQCYEWADRYEKISNRLMYFFLIDKIATTTEEDKLRKLAKDIRHTSVLNYESKARECEQKADEIKKERVYNELVGDMKRTVEEAAWRTLAEKFKALGGYKDSRERADKCESQAQMEVHKKQQLQYQKLKAKISDNPSEGTLEFLASEFRKLGNFVDSKMLADRFDRQLKELRKPRIYEELLLKKASNPNESELQPIEKGFRDLGDYMDAAALADECRLLKQEKELERKENEYIRLCNEKKNTEDKNENSYEVYRALASEFRKLSHRDSQQLANECVNIAVEKEEQSKQWIEKGLCCHCGGELCYWKTQCKQCSRDNEVEAVTNRVTKRKTTAKVIIWLLLIVLLASVTFSNYRVGQIQQEARRTQLISDMKQVSSIDMDEYTDDSIFAIGELVKFGDYIWRVLDAQEGKYLLITEHIVDDIVYQSDGTHVTWDNCTLRTYLNGSFYQSTFTDDERKIIVNSIIINNSNPWKDTRKGIDTNDNVFLLSIEEVVRYFGDSGLLSNPPTILPGQISGVLSDQFNSERRAQVVSETGNKFHYWWLRCPGWNFADTASVSNKGEIIVSGILSGPGNEGWAGVRPAVWIKP